MVNPQHWIERITKDLMERNEETITFSTAKTPSGPIHVGVGRELVYCSVFEKFMREQGRKTRFLFFVDDLDSLKSYPSTIPKLFTAHTEYLGWPMHSVPCPFEHCSNWAKHYADELIDSFPAFGFNPEIIWSHDLYQTREMKAIIRVALGRVEEIREIMRRVTAPTLAGEKLQSFLDELPTWYPCLVVCEKCGRLKDTKVIGYNSSKDTVTYICMSCENKGEVVLADWIVKLRWRIDWPAKWAIYKVSCEPAGKDHCVKGGAYDTGIEISSRIFGWKGPYRIPYEWILLGEHAMKTHKGISFTFKEWLAIAPAEAFRYLILREDPRKHITFLPERIPQIIDEFERAEQIFYGFEEATTSDEERNVRVTYPQCLLDKPKETIPPRLPYRFAIILAQLRPLLGEDKILKKSHEVITKQYNVASLSEYDVSDLKERITQAHYWVQHYAQPDMRFEVTPALSNAVKANLEAAQKQAARELAEMLKSQQWSEKELQYEIFELGKKLGLKQKIFDAVYLLFLGRKFGPRLAPFLLSLDRDFVLQRLAEASA